MSEGLKAAEVGTDGGDKSLTPEMLAGLKEEMTLVASDSQQFWQSRLDANDSRLCLWTGQSEDGRRWESETGKKSFLFDGESDHRSRLSDAMVNEDVRLAIVAMMRSEIRCDPRAAGDGAKANRQTICLRYWLDRMGQAWWTEWVRLANYVFGDSPGVGAMRVWWVRESGIDLKTMTVEELAELYMAAQTQQAQQYGVPFDQMAAQDTITTFMQMMADTTADDTELVTLVQGMFPDIKPARAAQVVKDIRKDGEAEFPVVEMVYEGPRVQAMRFGDDFQFRKSETNFDRATPWFMPVWMKRHEVEQMAVTDGWDQDFIDDVLKHDGEATFQQYESTTGSAVTQVSADQRKGQFQVVYCRFFGTTIDGYSARYEAVIHQGVDGSAFGRRMMRDKHGKWDAHFVAREALDKYLLNSRGIPELSSPSQGLIKMLTDDGVNNADLGAVPPFQTQNWNPGPNGTGADPIYLSQGAHVAFRGQGDAKYIQPPAYPASAMNLRDRLVEEEDNYHGRPTDKVPQQVSSVALQFKTGWWLMNVREVARMILALGFQYSSDAELLRICDAAGEKGGKGRKEIENGYDVQVVFDPDGMDLERLVKKGAFVRDAVIPLDTDKVIGSSGVAVGLIRAAFPSLAPDVIRPKAQAAQSEIEDELNNYSKIRAGVRPAEVTDGSQNYQLRMSVYDNMVQDLPTIFNDMAPDKRMMLQERLDFLAFQSQQFGENADIGRSGGKELGMEAPGGTTEG